ncbi:MAG: hypothetical protein HXX11_18905 [Desulfuromonadales bacterium]|nr:hypothetical protein [Desulfuromonadales bacterium]
MKRLIMPILLAAFLMTSLGGLCSASDQSELVGKWASVARTKGGLGTRYYFEESGIVMSSFGALVDFDYKIEGQMMKTNLKGEKEQTDSAPFEIVGDKLILNPSDQTTRQEMTRSTITATNAHPVVGVWSFKHYAGGMATMQYTTNGLAQLSVPFDTVKGKFAVQGQSLQIDFDGMPSVTREFRLEGNRLLFLPDGKNMEEKYIRVQP